MIQNITQESEIQEIFQKALVQAFDDFLEKMSNQNNRKDEIIDRKELMKRLSLSESTVIRWEKNGRIPSMIIGGNIRYNWGKVLDVLESKKKRR